MPLDRSNLREPILAVFAIVLIIWAIVWLFQIGLWPFLAIFLGCILLTIFVCRLT